MKLRKYVPSTIVLLLLASSPEVQVLAKEARPPKWSRDVLDTFFADARDTLNGPRPKYDANAEPNPAMAAHPSDLPSDFAWSKLIGADTIESEVKRLNQAVSRSVENASGFKGGGYKNARRDFSELAVLFAVIAQFDDDVRWKHAAAGLRDAFSQSAASAGTGTDESLRASAASAAVLSEVIRGERPPASKADAAVADWSQVATRDQLMQRLAIAHQERLTRWLADAATFRRKQSDVAHESQIIAMLAEVIHRNAYEFSDDDTYVGYAKELEQAATDVSAAAAAGNFDRANEAIGRATKACADCHDGYRG